MLQAVNTAPPVHPSAREVRICEVVAQLSARANFMFADGREAFESLTDEGKKNLRLVFDALADELRGLTERRHG